MTRLVADSLVLRYAADQAPVVDGVSAEFPEGTTTLVTGPSGSGKSTLLALLGLLVEPTSGTVLIDGRPVSALQDGERSVLRSRHIGFVFQDALLDPSRSARDNVLEPAVFAGLRRAAVLRRADELMERFGVADRADHRPGQISGGQAQRVALCRALLLRPPVVLGDEPTGNLDQENAEVVWSALAEAASDGAAVVVATHDDGRAARAVRRVHLR